MSFRIDRVTSQRTLDRYAPVMRSEPLPSVVKELRSISMTATYKDHPLAFLQAPTSPVTLAYRAENWRAKGFRIEGVDVADLLDRAARTLGTRLAVVNLIPKLFAGREEQVARSKATALCARRSDHEVEPDELSALATLLRTDGNDPYGGSIASSVESAVDEIVRLDLALASIATLLDDGESLSLIVAECHAATGTKMPEPTHEAPLMRM